MSLTKYLATWTCDMDAPEAGPLYHFRVNNPVPPPYKKTQRHVDAIIDIAEDGTFAGVELIDNMPPPPVQTIDVDDVSRETPPPPQPEPHPEVINFNAERANRANDNRLLSVADALEDALAEVRSGKNPANKALILFLKDDGVEGNYGTYFASANMRMSEMVSLMEVMKHKALRLLAGETGP